MGRLAPTRGRIAVPVEPIGFDAADPRPGANVREVVREAVAPFARLERELAARLERGDPASVARAGELAV